MALDKSRTSLGVKVVLIVVAIAMVSYLGASVFSIFDLFSGSGSTAGETTSTVDASASIAQKYTGRVAANDAALQSDPTSYTVLVDQGNAYFDWGIDTQQAASTNAALQGAEQPLWISAKQYYQRATEIKGDDPNVQVDYAIATFYSGDTANAIVIAEKVQKDKPDFAPAWFNLGVFYQAQGRNGDALAAYQKAVELDPNGAATNGDYAKQQIEALKGSANATGSPQGSVTTTP